MGVIPFWQEDVFLTVQNIDHQSKIELRAPYFIINCSKKFCLHLVPLANSFEPTELISLQERFHQDGLYLVHLWEDIWLAKRAQVLSRIFSFLGLNKSFHGRKTKVRAVTKDDSALFLNQYHLQGYIKAKYSYALFADEEIVALASFSDIRPMKSKGVGYCSAELVRFASKNSLTIVGGLSKLIKHFLKEVKVNDLMTYADRDWSLGKGYENLGFKLTTSTEPAYLFVDLESLTRYFPHRLPKSALTTFENQNQLSFDSFLTQNNFLKLFNTGNLKYHLYL